MKNNSNTKEITLGDKAKDYLRECLQEGHTLAQCMLRKIDLGKGIITTTLPSYVNDKVINDFYTGGKLKVNPEDIKDNMNCRITPVPNMDIYLAKLIRKFLNEKMPNICIMENALAKSNDPWIKADNTKLITYNEEVYHFLINKDLTDNMIKDTILSAKSIPIFIGVLATIPDEVLSLVTSKRENIINFEEFKIIVCGIKKIFVGAYDGEGYLVWDR